MALLEPSGPQGPAAYRAPSESRHSWLVLAHEIDPEVARYFLVSARCGCFMQAARSLNIKATLLRKRLAQLEEQLHEKKVEAHFTDAIKEMLAAKGFDPMMGARPMSRLIQDSIRAALADELLFGRLANGGKVTVDVDADGQVRLDFVEEASEAAAV